MKRLAIVLLFAVFAFAGKKKAEPAAPSPLDRYVAEAEARAAGAATLTPGSTWVPGSRLVDAGRDLRAGQVDDVVTIIVAEQASAVTSGTTKTQRNSSTQNSIAALGGLTKAAGPWANLASVSGNTQLDGQGTTSRVTTISTTLAARVTRVLPNGNLVVDASKDIQINSEHQIITLRGVVRPVDITPLNTVQSGQVGQLEVRVNGKGVVGDAIRRPFFLYRLLMGLLPF